MAQWPVEEGDESEERYKDISGGRLCVVFGV